MRRKRQVIAADAEYEQGLAFPMRLPMAQHHPTAEVKTLGGLMCLDLFAAVVANDVQVSLRVLDQ